jgi:alpha-beta hydrolase superfamily lysophospholipase
MTYIEETISTADLLRLYVRRSEADEPRGEVVVVHGFGDHSGRYALLMNHLVAQSYSVTAYDHRGHGLSDGLPGHIERFSEYEDDLDRIVAFVRARNGSQTIFLIGHSMGGLIALRYVAKKGAGLTGAVILSPLIQVAVRVPAHKLMVARWGARFAPRLRLGNGINPAALSRDPEVGRAYAADPLVNRLVSVRWFNEAVHSMTEVMALAEQIRLPLLVMHGTEDKLASVEATRQLFARVGSADKELAIYPGFYHELFNEPEKEEVFARVVEWLNRRAG